MSTAAPSRRPMDPAVLVAREKEDVLVGNEIIRHKLSSRVVHWIVAVTSFACVFTGMPIWTPVFGWMAHLWGGLTVCRVIHPWLGIAFFVAVLVEVIDWASDMKFEPQEKGWWGQKFFFWTMALGALGLLLSGLMMWFPRSFPRVLMQFAFLVHDATFILFMV